MFNSEGLSLSDIAAATGNGRNDGLGGGNGIWVLIILLALFGGWGNNGSRNGNNGGGETVVIPVPTYGGHGGGWGAYDAASMQRGFDTQSIIQKLDGLNSGLCGLGYDQQAQMNGLGTNLMQRSFELQQAVNADTVANMQNTNAISRQMSDCCCENRQGQAQIRWDMSQMGCNLQNTINQATQAIMQNDNANYRQLNDTIRDGFCALKMEQKDQQIAQLTAALGECNAEKLAQRTAEWAVNRVAPPAVPAFPAANPHGIGNWSPQVLAGGNYSSRCGNTCCSTAA